MMGKDRQLHSYGETGGRIRIHLDDLFLLCSMRIDGQAGTAVIRFDTVEPGTKLFSVGRGRIERVFANYRGVFCFSYLEYGNEKPIS